MYLIHNNYWQISCQSLSRDSVFLLTNMAAEDLPSEFDVVILGTGNETADFYYI